MTKVPPVLSSVLLYPLRRLPSVLTSDIKCALHFIFAQFIDSHARVFPSIKGAGLSNVEGQNSLIVLHQVLGILPNNHLVLHPDNLRLRFEQAELRKLKLKLLG